ncbi:uncharacterized protein L3040_007862 [Drepanopeziza brunnea f. sp. 'multigermtubi']|uniref:uncharacterized protein n=1 Tax=Drepanopeziza brunnea f. sp. 'multigermtubi' TaxID=698441 RepID=UPI002382C06F|nr:hypothetical protein L3040_007862 [Drepanopeziza brunnea f. sp. 'multigermtubi']
MAAPSPPSSSDITASPNGREADLRTENASPASPASPFGSLPDELIEYMLEDPSTSEPPRKRQKIQGPIHPKVLGIEHITVKKSTWQIVFAGSKLSELETPMEKSDVSLLVRCSRSRKPEYLEIVDGKRRCVFHAPLPPAELDLEDVHLALLVHDQSGRWARLEGRLWTECGLVLSQIDGYDRLQINFTIKWNVTSSPHNLMQAAAQTDALSGVLSRYFPNPNVTKAEKWSPQDFYQSVYSPDKTDEESLSMKVDGLSANLYPYQKRAVQWLLGKEGVAWSAQGVKSLPESKDPGAPISFVRATDDLGRVCYVSHLFGLVTLDPGPFLDMERNLRGGILAEEMGLGKTVEMISLISLHKRPDQKMPQVFDFFTGQMVRPTGATLIITPPSIIKQWISEINRHAPLLKVFHYEGIKAKVHSKRDFSDLLNDLASSDIVVSTYSVLAGEIHFTHLNPGKRLRHESKYPRPKSPLMLLSWWRCLIDEAQMIESGVSNAAVVARMIPRVNAWCVTGTPVRKDVNDLLGLLVFLRYEPFASIKHAWSSLITSCKFEFRKLFGTLALRHSKQSVRDELKLPAQRRYVITMPFTPIEEQHYQELFNQMCTEVGLDSQGAPTRDDWNPDKVSDIMRRWLVRLRQTALHPDVGGRNRRALGHKDGSLRTVDQVLNVMMESTDLSIRTDQRTLLITKLRRGQLFENSPRVKEALAIWVEAADEAKAIVEECRLQLQQELTKAVAENGTTIKVNMSGPGSDSEVERPELDPSSRIGAFRMRLRTAMEIEHMAIFFRTNAYFQIKSNEEMTKPNSDEFRTLEKLETEGYEAAKKTRRMILQENFEKTDKLMRKISRKAATQAFVQIPKFHSNIPKEGIESHKIMERLDILARALDAQANILDAWREDTVQFLLRSLIDEDEDDIDITGEEYEESTKIQDEVQVYLNCLRFVITDRHDALTGQNNDLVKSEVKFLTGALKDLDRHHVACPEKTVELLGVRQEIKPTTEMGSIRGIQSELRALAASLKLDAQRGSIRAQSELSIVEKQLKIIQTQFKEQMLAIADLKKEAELFTRSLNSRLEYYKQLQLVSDQVSLYDGPNDDATLARYLEEEGRLARKIATAKSKRRYLDHLREEAFNPKEQRICVICRETFEVGALTVCGHQYCKGCIRMWWDTHRNCPVCKRKLSKVDMHQITYKPGELSIQAEEVQDIHHERVPTSKKHSAIYSEISKATLAEIKNIELDGPSFTTKVDTLARHLIWLRESDPGAKSIIYSSFKDFLDVLAQAFSEFRIGYSSIETPKGIEKFKTDPGIECFLLHARAHSSGLNLVNANHVFLCEPLLNTALELQAIARVDRIGQQQETNVWLYLVDGTVEESIHQLSVKRRMDHIGKRIASVKGKDTDKEGAVVVDGVLDTTKLDEANSIELQQASLSGLLVKGGKGGEVVMKEDLWDCLFGGRQKEGGHASRGIGSVIEEEPQVGLASEVIRASRGAEAAEERQLVVGRRS